MPATTRSARTAWCALVAAAAVVVMHGLAGCTGTTMADMPTPPAMTMHHDGAAGPVSGPAIESMAHADCQVAPRSPHVTGAAALVGVVRAAAVSVAEPAHAAPGNAPARAPPDLDALCISRT